jgi:predicted RNase H-like nuclease
MADTPASLVLEIQRQVEIAQADALVELNRRHLQMWVRANPFNQSLPADLTIGGAATQLQVDHDLFDALVAGAVATFLREQGEGDPATLEALFQAACEEQYKRNVRDATAPGQPGQWLVDQVRRIFPDAPEADVVEELNERYQTLFRRANPFSTTTPGTLTVGSSAGEILLDRDMWGSLVDGTAATFVRRAGQDSSLLEQRFQQAGDEQLRRNRLRKAEETGAVQSMLDQIRQALGDVSEGDALEVLNQRYVQMWRRANRDAFPARLMATSQDSEVRVDRDLHRGLVDGALATFYRRRGQNPDALEATFAADAAEFARRAHRLVSPGPDTILLP